MQRPDHSACFAGTMGALPPSELHSVGDTLREILAL